MARVIEIVKAHLEANGFDGLVAVDAECGCLCDDLAPCTSDFGQCEPGYRGMHTEEPGEWAIYRTKAGALESVAEARNKTPNVKLTGLTRPHRSNDEHDRADSRGWSG